MGVVSSEKERKKKIHNRLQQPNQKTDSLNRMTPNTSDLAFKDSFSQL